VEGGFTVDDFAVHEQRGTVTCPAGHTAALSRTRVATFGTPPWFRNFVSHEQRAIQVRDSS
jgi:hypothetical protein